MACTWDSFCYLPEFDHGPRALIPRGYAVCGSIDAQVRLINILVDKRGDDAEAG